MKKRLFALMVSFAMVLTMGAAGIGTWNAYMAYHDITEIEQTGTKVYVLASNNLYSYNIADQSVQTFSKVNALSDCYISHIAWCPSAKRLVIIYEDGNIDLLGQDGQTVNVSDLYSKSMTNSKAVNDITVSGNYAYLSMTFGVIKLNVKDAEISDTYTLGVGINDVAILNNNIYAASSSGIYKASLTENLSDKGNWTNYNSQAFSYIFNLNGSLIGLVSNGAYSINPTTDNCDLFAYIPFAKATISGSRITCYGGSSSYVISGVGSAATVNGSYSAMTYDPTNNCYWTDADSKLQSVVAADDGTVTVKTGEINPDGPQSNMFGFMMMKNGKLYTTGGLSSSGKAAKIQIFDGTDWTIYSDSFKSTLDHSYIGAYCIDVDPKDENHLFLASQGGIYEFQNGEFVKNYTNDNSPLLTASTVKNRANKDYVIVSGLKFDDSGKMWCLNSISPSTSLFEYSNGTWTSHHKTELMVYPDRSLENMAGMMIDSRSLIWFVNDFYRMPSLVCYQPSTDGIKVYSDFVNEDGTTVEITLAHCVAEDKDGNIWCGTNLGPLELTSSDISTGGDTFQQIKVPRNDGTNYADYLLSGVNVSAMAIDGGNRKWFGSLGNGVYLINSDNITQIHHFTAENSSLLSNNIESISINETTGEVFFGTDKGLCSYLSDATAPSTEMTKDNVYAYPNPVRPDYTGLITVVGLSYNAYIKIVTTAGTLVAEGQSNGGTFTWDGCDKRGRRVASGVYMVETAKEDGSKGTVCKIAVVN